jgi:hypothetical protein
MFHSILFVEESYFLPFELIFNRFCFVDKNGALLQVNAQLQSV